MTWNIRDVQGPKPDKAPPRATGPSAAAGLLETATPRVALALELAAEPEADWTPSPELRRELAHAGLIDDQTWAAYRRLLTRGLIAE